MTDTVISSATKEVVIGFDRPFVIIGERINPTGRKLLAAEMAQGDYSRVKADALAQVAAGAQMLDVNAGIPMTDEPRILAETIQLVQSLTDVPLSIDSSIVAALEAGLAVYKGKALLNSVTGEEERLEVILPLVKKYDCAVIAISNDETGISEDPDVRFEVAKKIVNRAADYGIVQRRNFTLDYLNLGFDEFTPPDVVAPYRRGSLPFKGMREDDGSRTIGREYSTWLLNPRILLPKLAADLAARNVPRRVMTFDNVQQVEALPENLVINCTGLGAKTLFRDPKVIPKRGLLVRLRGGLPGGSASHPVTKLAG